MKTKDRAAKSKTEQREQARQLAKQREITYDALRGFKVITAYLARFPAVTRNRIIGAVQVIHS